METPVTQFQDFRPFLTAAFQARKRKNPRFSLGAWAKLLGLRSSSTLIMILKGERNPGKELVEKLVADLRLGSYEADHFRCLVSLAKARNPDVRRLLLARLQTPSTRREYHHFSPAYLHVITGWLPMTLRELVNLPAFREDPEWIRAHLLFPATETEIRTALRALEDSGLLTRNAKRRLVNNTSMELTRAVPKEESNRLHDNWFRLCSDANHAIDPSRRAMMGITFSMRAENFPLLRQQLQDFLRDLPFIDEPGADSIHHIQVGCFPVSK
jgi:uncharacterized protein (TIGR02147 family)